MTVSIKKEDEAPQLREEIGQRVGLQDALFLAAISATGLVAGLAIQFNGLVAALIPVVLLPIALRINSHSTRVGQLNFTLRFVLKSPWEIVRRWLFDGELPSSEEMQILAEQGIVITREMLDAARKQQTLFREQKTIEKWLLFGGFNFMALTILATKTYQQIQAIDPLSLGVWMVALAATIISIPALQHKRVRAAMKEGEQ